MDDLPGEILSEIFIRLLAKQLAQMRCVSKSWNALLSQPSFIKFHLHRSIHNNDKTILVFMDEVFSFDRKPFTAHSTRSPHLELTKFIKLPINLQKRYYRVIGSINGLICFSDASDVNIWNPSLNAMLNIPPLSILSHCYSDSNICQIRFGFDPKTDDYKVVKFMGVHRQPSSSRSNGYFIQDWQQVVIYSMRKGSWYLITQRIPSCVIRIHSQAAVCVDGHDGHLHWLCYIDEEMKAQTIVAFDLGVETFYEIPLPDSKLHHHGHYWFSVLGVLDGKLCAMSRAKGERCEVWVMEEYRVAESWVKHHVFSQFSGIIPIGFTSHSEFVFYGYPCGLALFDPISAKVKSIGTPTTHVGMIKILEYVDSLVWIAPVKREIMCFNISDHFAKLKRGFNTMVNGTREIKTKTLVLIILSFLIFICLMIFFEIRFVSST
ncbi:F-box/kelch-repeat protein At3g06240 [Lactuca sativa]|uniref:F-box/kelch-repeat protein At3g06240 n=1 Tax=Lactuca sativa TaxID=4236 RepID=UPI0022B00913|nr:F-box/kelch-repeat protein At3g06240 [Lactuca sativa]